MLKRDQNFGVAFDVEEREVTRVSCSFSNLKRILMVIIIALSTLFVMGTTVNAEEVPPLQQEISEIIKTELNKYLSNHDNLKDELNKIISEMINEHLNNLGQDEAKAEIEKEIKEAAKSSFVLYFIDGRDMNNLDQFNIGLNTNMEEAIKSVTETGVNEKIRTYIINKVAEKVQGVINMWNERYTRTSTKELPNPYYNTSKVVSNAKMGSIVNTLRAKLEANLSTPAFGKAVAENILESFESTYFIQVVSDYLDNHILDAINVDKVLGEVKENVKSVLSNDQTLRDMIINGLEDYILKNSGETIFTNVRDAFRDYCIEKTDLGTIDQQFGSAQFKNDLREYLNKEMNGIVENSIKAILLPYVKDITKAQLKTANDEIVKDCVNGSSKAWLVFLDAIEEWAFKDHDYNKDGIYGIFQLASDSEYADNKRFGGDIIRDNLTKLVNNYVTKNGKIIEVINEALGSAGITTSVEGNYPTFWRYAYDYEEKTYYLVGPVSSSDSYWIYKQNDYGSWVKDRIRSRYYQPYAERNLSSDFDIVYSRTGFVVYYDKSGNEVDRDKIVGNDADIPETSNQEYPSMGAYLLEQIMNESESYVRSTGGDSVFASIKNTGINTVKNCMSGKIGSEMNTDFIKRLKDVFETSILKKALENTSEGIADWINKGISDQVSKRIVEKTREALNDSTNLKEFQERTGINLRVRIIKAIRYDTGYSNGRSISLEEVMNSKSLFGSEWGQIIVPEENEDDPLNDAKFEYGNSSYFTFPVQIGSGSLQMVIDPAWDAWTMNHRFSTNPYVIDPLFGNGVGGGGISGLSRTIAEYDVKGIKELNAAEAYVLSHEKNTLYYPDAVQMAYYAVEEYTRGTKRVEDPGPDTSKYYEIMRWIGIANIITHMDWKNLWSGITSARGLGDILSIFSNKQMFALVCSVFKIDLAEVFGIDGNILQLASMLGFSFENILGTIADTIGNWGSLTEGNNFLGGLAQNIWNGAKSIVEGAWKKVTSVFDTIKSIPNDIKNVLASKVGVSSLDSQTQYYADKIEEKEKAIEKLNERDKELTEQINKCTTFESVRLLETELTNNQRQREQLRSEINSLQSGDAYRTAIIVATDKLEQLRQDKMDPKNESEQAQAAIDANIQATETAKKNAEANLERREHLESRLGELEAQADKINEAIKSANNNTSEIERLNKERLTVQMELEETLKQLQSTYEDLDGFNRDIFDKVNEMKEEGRYNGEKAKELDKLLSGLENDFNSEKLYTVTRLAFPTKSEVQDDKDREEPMGAYELSEEAVALYDALIDYEKFAEEHDGQHLVDLTDYSKVKVSYAKHEDMIYVGPFKIDYIRRYYKPEDDAEVPSQVLEDIREQARKNGEDDQIDIISFTGIVDAELYADDEKTIRIDKEDWEFVYPDKAADTGKFTDGTREILLEDDEADWDYAYPYPNETFYIKIANGSENENLDGQSANYSINTLSKITFTLEEMNATGKAYELVGEFEQLLWGSMAQPIPCYNPPTVCRHGLPYGAMCFIGGDHWHHWGPHFVCKRNCCAIHSTQTSMLRGMANGVLSGQLGLLQNALSKYKDLAAIVGLGLGLSGDSDGASIAARIAGTIGKIEIDTATTALDATLLFKERAGNGHTKGWKYWCFGTSIGSYHAETLNDLINATIFTEYFDVDIEFGASNFAHAEPVYQEFSYDRVNITNQLQVPVRPTQDEIVKTSSKLEDLNLPFLDGKYPKEYPDYDGNPNFPKDPYEINSDKYTDYPSIPYYGAGSIPERPLADPKYITKEDYETNPVIPLTFEIGGTVWLDNPTGIEFDKSGKPQYDGIYNEGSENGIPNVEVVLHRRDETDPENYIQKTLTDKDGKYKFEYVRIGFDYYIEFIYDGVTYRSTNYMGGDVYDYKDMEFLKILQKEIQQRYEDALAELEQQYREALDNATENDIQRIEDKHDDRLEEIEEQHYDEIAEYVTYLKDYSEVVFGNMLEYKDRFDTNGAFLTYSHAMEKADERRLFNEKFAAIGYDFDLENTVAESAIDGEKIKQYYKTWQSEQGGATSTLITTDERGITLDEYKMSSRTELTGTDVNDTFVSWNFDGGSLLDDWLRELGEQGFEFDADKLHEFWLEMTEEKDCDLYIPLYTQYIVDEEDLDLYDNFDDKWYAGDEGEYDEFIHIYPKMQNINFGLVKREEGDWGISTELYKVYTVFQDDIRYEKYDNFYTDYKPEDGDDGIFDVLKKSLDYYTRVPYRVLIDPSDYNYKADGANLNGDNMRPVTAEELLRELEVYFELKILIKNNALTRKGRIITLDTSFLESQFEYLPRYAGNFEHISSWIEPRNAEDIDGTSEDDKEKLLWYYYEEGGKNRNVNGYNTIYTHDLQDRDIAPSEIVELHLILRVKKDAWRDIIVDPGDDDDWDDDDDDDEWDDDDDDNWGWDDDDDDDDWGGDWGDDDDNKIITEIIKYSYDDGLINKGGNPGSVEYGNCETYPNSADPVPNIEIVIDKHNGLGREISGYVWEDQVVGMRKDNNQFESNGVIDSNEPKINNVKVQLIKVENAGEYSKEYEHTVRVREAASEEESFYILTGQSYTNIYGKNVKVEPGQYRFTNLPAGAYKVMFTYGDTTQLLQDITYNGQDYKSISLDVQRQEYDDPKLNLAILVDTAASMKYVNKQNDENTKSKLEKMLDSAEALTERLFKDVQKTKIGVVPFAEHASTGNDYAGFGANNWGTLYDKGSIDTVVSAIRNIGKVDKKKNVGPILADAIEYALGGNMFGDRNNGGNKVNPNVILILTDGYTYDASTRAADRNALARARTQGVKVITVIANTDEWSIDPYGTESNPTSGKVYNIREDRITYFVEEVAMYEILREFENTNHSQSQLTNLLDAKDVEYKYPVSVEIGKTGKYESMEYTRYRSNYNLSDMTYANSNLVDVERIRELQKELGDTRDDRKKSELSSEINERISKLANATKVTAVTPTVVVRLNKRDKAPGINLGLVERPKVDVRMQEKVQRIVISLSNGQVLIDTDTDLTQNIQKVNNKQFSQYKSVDNAVMYRSIEPMKAGKYTIFMDEEIMQGSRIDITYQITITNNSQVDTLGNYYYYDMFNEKSREVATRSVPVVIATLNNYYYNLTFRPEENSYLQIERNEVADYTSGLSTNKDSGKEVITSSRDLIRDGKSYTPNFNLDPELENGLPREIFTQTVTWTEQGSKSTIPLIDSAQSKLNNSKIKLTETKSLQEVGLFSNYSKQVMENEYVPDEKELEKMNSDLMDVSKELVKGERRTTFTINNNAPRQRAESSINIYITYSKSLSANDKDDTLEYQNSSEIVERKHQLGRRDYAAIVGNYVPMTTMASGDAERDERDSYMAEDVIITPPFGEDRDYTIYVLVALGSVMILGVGIVFIKKKVL